MRLSSLSIRNFRVLKSADLAFTDEVIGITGPNGGGKTSIVEAVAWALYGNQAARSGKEEIKSIFARPEENCEVRLDFLINEEKYRVIRRLAGRTQRAEVELYRGEASESVGVNETKKYVGELLGLDWKGFLTSFLARQQELNALSVLQPARRKDHLAGMLGIDRLERAIQRVKESAKVAAGQAEVLARQLAEQDSLKEAIRQLQIRRSDLETAVGRAESAKKAAEAIFTAARDSYMAAQEARGKWVEAGARLEAAQKTVADLNRRLADLRKEADQLARAEEEAVGLRHQLDGLDPARRELEALNDARSRRQYRDQLAKQATELESEQKSISAALAKSDQTLAAIDKELAEIAPTTAVEAEKAKADLEHARQEYSRLLAEQKSHEVQRDKLTAQMTSITKLGPDSVCDRCLRPLGDDLTTIRRHLGDELDSLRSTLDRIGVDLKDALASGAKLKDQAQKLEACAARRAELGIKRESAAREQTGLGERRDDLTRRIEAVRVKLIEAGTVEFDASRYDTVRKTVEALEAVQTRLNRLEGSLTRRQAVTDGIAEMEQSVTAATAECAEHTRNRDSLGYSEESFASARVKFEKTQKDAESAREAAMAAVKEFELTGKELEGKQALLARLDKAREELEEHRTRHFYDEKLAALFAEFRELLISRIRPTLSDISSRLIAEMTGGRYTMVELDERYNLQVLDSGTYYGVERFSGGEKDLANLCLRLAISEALVESAGMNRSFIILDEVFGSQDDGRKELIIQALTNLKHRFPQIFLITHVGDIKDRVECLVEVNPTGYGWSTVMVNGAPA